MTASIFRFLVAGIAAVAVAVTLLAATWTSSSRGDASPAVVQATPDWFGPIWDYYDRNPAITPAFDFAVLYSSELPEGIPTPRRTEIRGVRRG